MNNYNLSTNYEAMYHGAVNAGVQYLLKHKSIKSLIIGVSGGIDSAVSCMLAKAACDKLTDRKVTLIGRSIAIESNTKDEIKRAKEVGKAFCDDFEHIDLTVGYYVLYNLVDPGPITDNSKIRGGNVKARLRMMYLYNLASKYNGLVLSNDNLTEYMVGFWTLHGDVGDFGFIQNLWKTEVYGLADWWVNNTKLSRDAGMFGLSHCVDAVPTDGLGITNSDLDQLLPKGYSIGDGLIVGRTGVMGNNHRRGYRGVDNTLIDYLSEPTPHPHPRPYVRHDSVIRRHLRTQFKRDNPFSVERNLLIP
jgi:NAD+ synthetase